MKNIEKKVLTPFEILNVIKSNELRKKYKYIIMGRIGPTGKTWITQELKRLGLDAVEITENVSGRIFYKYDENFVSWNEENKVCVISLCHEFDPSSTN